MLRFPVFHSYASLGRNRLLFHQRSWLAVLSSLQDATDGSFHGEYRLCNSLQEAFGHWNNIQAEFRLRALFSKNTLCRDDLLSILCKSLYRDSPQGYILFQFFL